MDHQQLWQEFIRVFPQYREAVYEPWLYGSDDPDLLLRLTLEGVKTATASSLPLYEYENEQPPQAGQLSVISDTKGQARCVVRAVRVYTVPFRQVPAEQAWKEGEGDRSLDYWRRVHEDFFTLEMKEAGLSFSWDMPVVCEEFELLYKK